MHFEYDINKSNSNKTKHGVDFEEAKELFYDENSITFPTKYTKEERYFVVGKIKTKIFTAIITFRDANIRIISVRRARDKEIMQYERFKDARDNS